MPTIGVSISIPEPWGSQLQDYRTSLGDATASLIPSHITLVPPTDVDAAVLPALVEHLEEAADGFDPFEILLRGTGTFRPVSPVVFIAVAEGISPVELLAARIRRGPLAVDLDFPFHPHVTVAHHLEDPVLDRAFDELADFEARFEVRGFHLYEHDEASGWHPTHDVDLRPVAVG